MTPEGKYGSTNMTHRIFDIAMEAISHLDIFQQMELRCVLICHTHNGIYQSKLPGFRTKCANEQNKQKKARHQVHKNQSDVQITQIWSLYITIKLCKI